MKVVGIVAEYNPFHNGHAYHIQKAKEITGCEYCIVVMSGDYTQRGVPAMIDKYSRAKMALLNGADLVIELPVRFATSSAEGFATCAISLLNATGIVTDLCFGSECGNVEKLSKIAKVLLDEPEEYKEALKRELKNGHAYPVARNMALQGLDFWDFDSLKILSMPNNILGIEYIKALLKTESKMNPVTIQRKGSNYNDCSLSELYSSAMAIRSSIATTNNLENIFLDVPQNVYSIMKEKQNTSFPIVPDDFSKMLHYKILSEKDNGFAQYIDVNADLSDRISKNVYQYRNYENFCEILKTKNITYTRISRCLIHILLNLKNNNDLEVSYLRILGLNTKAGELSKALKEYCTLPLISKMADSKKLLSEDALSLLKEDVFASDLYNIVLSHKFNTDFVSDYQKQIQTL
jgi:predicted nucleotidyltransferase